MRITLENDEREQVTIDTNTLDHAEGVSPDGTRFVRVDDPTNLPGERWDTEDGETFWRV